jgi:hypothetical protein
MRKTVRSQYRFINPPKALSHARLDNIAIIPASMLPFRQALQELVNNLPEGAVFLCHSQENTRQRRLLERVGQAFREQGHAVVNMPLERFQRNASQS